MEEDLHKKSDEQIIDGLKSRVAELERQLTRCCAHAKIYQEELRNQTWFLQNIFDNTPVAISIFNKDAKLIRFNNKFSRMFGIQSKAEVIGKGFFIHQISKERMEAVKDNNKTEHHIDFDLDHAHYASSRKGIINLSQKVIKMYDAKGNHYGYVNMSTEDTDRLMAVNKVHDFENFFSFISDFAKIGYTKVNLYNNTGYAIKQWYKNLGEIENVPLDHVIGIYRNVHPDDRKKLLDYLGKIRTSELTSYQMELRVRKSTARTSWNWLRIYGIVTEYAPEKHIIEVISVNYDITELKDTEEALRKARDKAETTDKLKSAFLANMSHEIRTPLNAIVGFSNLLCESDDEKERLEFRTIIQNNSKVLLQLISDILDLSKMESGSLDYNFKRMNVNDLCRTLILTLQSKTNPGVDLSFDKHLHECHIVSDNTRLHQLLTNFLTNAIKHTTSGSIRLGYTIEGKNISFYVKDTGTGIPKEQQKTIFERFVKLDNFIPGTGLGLSICKNIAKQLGGRISVSSKEGVGSTFRFTMPYGKHN